MASTTAMLLLTLALLAFSTSSAFTSVCPSFTRNAVGKSAATRICAKGDFDDLPPSGEEEGIESEVDWDAEWKKVVNNQDQPKKRPGSDFYKSDMEIAAIKAANKAQKQISSKVPKPNVSMNWSSLQGDWKFWIGILAIISIGTSIISASGQQQLYTDDSFYV